MAEAPTSSDVRSRLDAEFQPAGKLNLTDTAVVARKDQTWLLVLLAVVVGTVLRLYMLGVKSLWLDEAFSVYAARLSWRDFFHAMWWGEANMALYYFLLRGWIQLGHSEFWLRSLSVLFGVASIPALYALGGRFLSRKAGLIAAALLAIHCFHIHHSQDLRSYGLLTLLLILSFYAFLAVLETPERKSLWVLWILFSTLSIYAQIFAVVALASQWLVLTPSKIKRLGITQLMTATVAIAVLTAPMAAVVLFEHKDQLGWVPRLNAADVSAVFQDLVGAGLESANTARGLVLLSLYLATWVAGLAYFFLARRKQANQRAANLAVPVLAWWFTFPLAMGIGISFWKPILVPRYTLMCVPAALLLASWGLLAIDRLAPHGRLISSSVLLSIVGLTLWGTWDHYARFKTYGNDWRGVTQYILSHAQPGDAVVFYTFSGHRDFAYYVDRERDAGGTISIPAVLYPLALDAQGIEKRTESYQRVWFVLHHMRPTPITDAETEVIQTALEAHFRLAGQRQFPGSGVYRGESGHISVALYAAAPTNQAASK